MVSCDRIRRTAEKTVVVAAAGVDVVAFETLHRRCSNSSNNTQSVLSSSATAAVVEIVNCCTLCRRECSLAEVLFNYCQHCSTMPALPQGAFAACKIRAQNDARTKWPVAKEQPQHGGTSKPTAAAADLFPKWKLMDLTPLKYNSKFMNAIWGHYNRYSPHNIKSNEANRGQTDECAAWQQQQQHHQ